MRSCPKLSAILLGFASVLGTVGPVAAQETAQASGRVVLVLPFDNRSGNTSLNWVGDSFPDTLNKRLSSAGFLTISQDDRNFALTHLGLPADFRPSRATTIRIAQQLDANYIVVGSYNVDNDRISIQSKVLSVNALRLSEPVEDGAEMKRLYDAENAIAWKVARSIDPHFPIAEQTFLAAAGAVPLPAFENYIRGTDAPSSSERLKRLQAAVAAAPEYSAALLALGKNQYTARDYAAAAATLAKVPKTDRLALEANFYLGLARFNSTNYAGAEAAFAFVAERLPLPEVLNDQAVALSRQGKDAVALFQRASADDPNDADYHYNTAVALFRRGDTAAALREADAALKLKPADREAAELRSRLSALAPGVKLASLGSDFTAVERIRRSYTEAGYRQAAFQLEQMRSARLSLLPPAQRAAEYTQLGRESLGSGLVPEAEAQFGAALTADPNSVDAHAGMAEVRERTGNGAEARSEAQSSLKLHPNVPALLVLARLDLAANQLPASASSVAQALSLEPSNAAAQALRATLQQRGQTLP